VVGSRLGQLPREDRPSRRTQCGGHGAHIGWSVDPVPSPVGHGDSRAGRLSRPGPAGLAVAVQGCRHRRLAATDAYRRTDSGCGCRRGRSNDHGNGGHRRSRRWRVKRWRGRCRWRGRYCWRVRRRKGFGCWSGRRWRSHRRRSERWHPHLRRNQRIGPAPRGRPGSVTAPSVTAPSVTAPSVTPGPPCTFSRVDAGGPLGTFGRVDPACSIGIAAPVGRSSRPTGCVDSDGPAPSAGIGRVGRCLRSVAARRGLGQPCPPERLHLRPRGTGQEDTGVA
jgi:hypothetical protein